MRLCWLAPGPAREETCSTFNTRKLICEMSAHPRNNREITSGGLRSHGGEMRRISYFGKSCRAVLQLELGIAVCSQHSTSNDSI